MVERDLEEVNGHFDHHRGEINRIKEREKEARGLIVGAAHKAEQFKTRLDRMEDNICKCRHTPSEVGEECQEIVLVAFIFFFELLFPYVSLTISFYVSPTNLFSIILFLIC